MKPLKSLHLLFPFLLALSCNREHGYVITATISGLADSSIFYLQDPNTQEYVDTAVLMNGTMEFRGRFAETPTEMFLMSASDKPFVYMYLLIGNEQVHITGDVKDFPFKVKVTGSKTQEELAVLTKQTAPYDENRSALVDHFFALPETEQEKQGKAFSAQLDQIDSITYKLRVQFVQQHYDTYAGLITLWDLKKSLPKDTVLALLSKLPADLKTHKYAQGIEMYLNNEELKIGDDYKDFSAENADGNTVKLSSLLDRNILLDFTSAGCGPCIMATPELREIDSTCSDSLRIVSFSVDVKKDSWLSSLHRDHVTWTSLWDGKGPFSEPYIAYGVSGYPTFVLINSKGKITDRFVGYGKGSLLEKLGKFKDR